MTLKPPITGLIQRDGRRAAAFAGAISNLVLQPSLADCWPAQGTMNFAPIDALIAQAKKDGIKNARLRVNTGLQAPKWISALVGTYRIAQPTNTTTGTYDCPIWWDQRYVDAHVAFDLALAKRYDPDPFISEATVWAVGSTFSAEAAIRQFSDPANLASALKAGFSTKADLSACYYFVDAMNSHWTDTRLHAWIPMGWQTVIGTGTAARVKQDLSVLQTYAKHILTVDPNADLGIDNADQVAYAKDPTYAMRKALPGLRTYGDQTATWKKLGSSGSNLLTTLKNAAADGAASMELPAGYQNGVTAAQLAPLDAALRKNARG